MQTFVTRGRAPTNLTSFAHHDVGLDLRTMLYRGLYLPLDASLETYGYNDGDTQITATVVGQASVGLGWMY